MFGLDPVDGKFWEQIIELVLELPETHYLTLAVDLSALILAIFLGRRYKRFPTTLIVEIYDIAILSALNLGNLRVHVFGEIRSRLARSRSPISVYKHG